MSWTLDGHRIYVEKDSGWYYTPRKGTVELLDTNYSILHTAGSPSYRRDLTFVVFENFETDILPLAAEAVVTLVDDTNTSSNVSILEFKSERLYDYKLRKIYRVNITVIQV